MGKKLTSILSTTLIATNILTSQPAQMTFEETVVPGVVEETDNFFTKIQETIFESFFYVPHDIVLDYSVTDKIRLENEIQALKEDNVDFLYWATSGIFDQPIHSKDITKSYKKIKDKYLTFDLFDASSSANINPFDNQYQLTMEWDF